MPPRSPLQWPIQPPIWDLLERLGTPTPFPIDLHPGGYLAGLGLEGHQAEVFEALEVAVVRGFLVRVEEPWLRLLTPGAAPRLEPTGWVVDRLRDMLWIQPWNAARSKRECLIEAKAVLAEGVDRRLVESLRFWYHPGAAWWRWSHVLEATHLAQVRPLLPKKGPRPPPPRPAGNRPVATPVFDTLGMDLYARLVTLGNALDPILATLRPDRVAFKAIRPPRRG